MQSGVGSQEDSSATEETQTDLADIFSSLPVEDVEPLDAAPDGDAEPEKEKRGLFGRFGKRKGKESKPTPPMPRQGGIAGPVAALYRRVGTFVVTFDAGCGNALIQGAEDCGKAWEEVCRRNPQIRRYILAFLAAGAHAELLVAHAPILAAVAIHHVPAVRQMIAQTTENMTAMFNEELSKMQKENVFNNAADHS